jgi:hypothetical protein
MIWATVLQEVRTENGDIVLFQKRILVRPRFVARASATCFLVPSRGVMSGQTVGNVSSVAPSFYPR